MSDDQEVQRPADYTSPAVQQGTQPGSQALVLDSFLAQAMSNPDIDITRLQALWEMRKQIMADVAKAEFEEAFERLQASLPRVKANGVLQYPKNKNDPDGPQKHVCNFAKYEDVWETVAPFLNAEGFTVTFDNAPRPGDGGGLITTCILSRKGYSKRSSIPVPLDNSGGKNSLQGYGSSQSYGMRYSLRAAINFIVEGEDDDGKRGGARFITENQAEELRKMCQVAGRVEGTILQRLFAGAVRSFEELEIGNGYLAAKSTLEGILHQQQKRGTE